MECLKDRFKTNPVLSVCLVTYNHEKYISKALDSILMQKVNFEYEIVAGEDYSSDNTRKFLLDYYEKYPDKFKLILQDKNVGLSLNVFDTFNACSGKYVAFLEGDDYWTDENKLQKQVDYLEANPDYGLIFTNVYLVDENDNKLPENVKEHFKAKQIYEGDVFIKLLKNGNFINNCTACIRKDTINKYIKKNIFKYGQDMLFWLIVSSVSKIKYLNIETLAYRRHRKNLSADPDTIVGRKTWRYSVLRGIECGLKSRSLDLSKQDIIYLFKLLINRLYKSKYIFLKYLSLKLIFMLIFKYYFKINNWK